MIMESTLSFDVESVHDPSVLRSALDVLDADRSKLVHRLSELTRQCQQSSNATIKQLRTAHYSPCSPLKRTKVDFENSPSKKVRMELTMLNLLSLPPELLFKIYCMLPMRDLLAVGSTCRYLRDTLRGHFSTLKEISVQVRRHEVLEGADWWQNIGVLEYCNLCYVDKPFISVHCNKIRTTHLEVSPAVSSNKEFGWNLSKLVQLDFVKVLSVDFRHTSAIESVFDELNAANSSLNTLIFKGLDVYDDESVQMAYFEDLFDNVAFLGQKLCSKPLSVGLKWNVGSHDNHGSGLSVVLRPPLVFGFLLECFDQFEQKWKTSQNFEFHFIPVSLVEAVISFFSTTDTPHSIYLILTVDDLSIEKLFLPCWSALKMKQEIDQKGELCRLSNIHLLSPYSASQKVYNKDVDSTCSCELKQFESFDLENFSFMISFGFGTLTTLCRSSDFPSILRVLSHSKITPSCLILLFYFGDDYYADSRLQYSLPPDCKSTIQLLLRSKEVPITKLEIRTKFQSITFENNEENWQHINFHREISIHNCRVRQRIASSTWVSGLNDSQYPHNDNSESYIEHEVTDMFPTNSAPSSPWHIPIMN